jgi:hypothetical protein
LPGIGKQKAVAGVRACKVNNALGLTRQRHAAERVNDFETVGF